MLASALGLVAGLALLAAAWSFVFGFGAGPGACACSPPAVDLAFETNESDGVRTLKLTHERGDPVPVDEVVVVVDGETRPWPAENASGDFDGEPAVIAGDSYRLTGVDDGTTVRVRWESAQRDASATLAKYTVGE